MKSARDVIADVDMFDNERVGWDTATAILSALEKHGYAVVPVEPTEAMLTEGGNAGGYDAYWQKDNTRKVWCAMLAAHKQSGDV